MHRRAVVWGCFCVLILVGGAGVARADKKVTLCHRPPGNPSNAHTISVGEAATAAHLKHGDQLGECPSGCQLNASLCDDANACTSDVCLTNGACDHALVNCDDGNACTTDVCQESSGCLSIPANGTSCDDGNACTSNDACAGGGCNGTPVAGCCTTSADCDDGDACTVDACVESACTNTQRDCTVADKCLAGFCDPTTGECDTAPVNCSDSNVCTDDSCDPVSGCLSQPTTNPPETTETSCADGVDNDCDGAVDTADFDCRRCGDGVVQPPEQCDGSDLDGADCNTEAPCPLGFVCDAAFGTVACSAACTLVVGNCQRCGNGVREGTEQCDGAQLGGATCQSLGFDAGSLACFTPSAPFQHCALDVSGCFNVCGNGVCHAATGECQTCPADCGPSVCGP